MTASARRGPAYSRSLADAPFIDTRFVDAPATTATNVPPLDFTWLNGPGSSQHLRANSGSTTTATTRDQTLYGRTGKVEGPMYPVPPLRKKQTSFSDPATTFGSGTTADRHGSNRPRNPAVQTYFQDPGLTHPNPPDIPALESKRAQQSMDSRRESLSARLARLADVGHSARVAPIELV